MNYLRSKRSLIVFFPAIITFLLTLLFSTSTFAATKNGNDEMPGVVLLVMATSPNTNIVSMNYPKLVNHSLVERDLQNLTAATKWSILNKSITDEGTMSSGASYPMTSVEFATSQAVDLNSGAFNIEPVILGLKHLKRIQIIYFVPSSFQFRGLDKFQNRFVKINSAQSGSTYQYNILVKRTDFKSLDLPLYGSTRSDGASGLGHRIFIMVLVFLTALAFAVLVYIVTDRASRNNRRRPRQRS